MNKKAIKELKAKLAKGKCLISTSIAISKKYHCDYQDVKFYAICLSKEA